MTRTFISVTALALGLTAIGSAQDEALKQRVSARSASVVELLTTGVLTEGADGLLKPVGQLELPHSQLMKEENQDREEIFKLIAAKSNVPLEEVQSLYAKKARAKYPPTAAAAGGMGVCKLTPAKAPDVARLLQYLKQGIQFAEQRKFDNALAEFQPALAIDSNFLALNQNVGSAQMGLKKYPEAEASFKAELKLVDCLAGLNDTQLASFGYFYEIAEKDPAKKKRLQAAKLKAELPKVRAAAHYNLACAYSRQQQKTQSLAALQAAVDAGFNNKRAMASDPDLLFVRQTPEFREMAGKL